MSNTRSILLGLFGASLLCFASPLLHAETLANTTSAVNASAEDIDAQVNSKTNQGVSGIVKRDAPDMLPRLTIQAMHRQSSVITAIAFINEDKNIATFGNDLAPRTWDVATGKLVSVATLNAIFHRTVYVRKQNVLIAQTNDGITVLNAATGQVLRDIRNNKIKVFEVNTNGTLLAFGDDDGVIVIQDLITGEPIHRFQNESKTSISDLDFSPKNDLLLSVANYKRITILNLSTWNVQYQGTSEQITRTARFLRDSQTFLTVEVGDDKTDIATINVTNFSLGETSTKAVIKRETGATSTDVVELSNQRQYLAIGGFGHVSVVDTVNFNTVLTLNDRTYGSKLGNAVTFNSDDKLLAVTESYSSNANAVSIYQLPSGTRTQKIVGREGGETVTIQFSAGGDKLGVLQQPTDRNGNATTWYLLNNKTEVKTSSFKILAGQVQFTDDLSGLYTTESPYDQALINMKSGQTININLASYNQQKVLALKRINDVASVRTHKIFESSWARAYSVSTSGKYAVSSEDSPDITLWNLNTNKPLRRYSILHNYPSLLKFNGDSEIAAVGSDDNSIYIFELARTEPIQILSLPPDASNRKTEVTSLAFCPNKQLIGAAYTDGRVRIFNFKTGDLVREMASWARAVAFHPSCEVMASANGDRVDLWSIAQGTQLAFLTGFLDGTWVVTDPEGRFDTADLENMPHLHWVMQDDPFTPVSLEAFMKDYYEPRLLARILAGEKFAPVRPLTSLNRTQPEVKITSVVPDTSDSSVVTVTVSATGATKDYLQDGKPVARATAMHDLRLFRNGQMVGYAEGKLAEAGGQPFQRSFRVRLPSGKAPLNFTAYAFNDDRVKSATAQQSYTPPSAIVVGKPRAYLVTVGVNRHDNPAWNLRYAANDARQIGLSLAPLLKNQKSYEEVVTVPLISDSEGPDLATKANIKAVLDVLAGRKADVGAIPGGDKLRQASPDDLVLISFSGHGFGEGGLFYLIPGDTGAGSGREITPELTAHAVSSDELSAWLRDVDAGDMAMIVDACHSAASVGDEFKPGPMGSRGLGQLAFDKGMRILAASQADDVALESDLIKQGLLSFALVENGLESHQADFKPKDKKITLEEWLSYGVNRVPSLAEEVKSGTVVASRGAVRTAAGELKKKRVIQQPALFDFTKGRRDAVLEAGLK